MRLSVAEQAQQRPPGWWAARLCSTACCSTPDPPWLPFPTRPPLPRSMPLLSQPAAADAGCCWAQHFHAAPGDRTRKGDGRWTAAGRWQEDWGGGGAGFGQWAACRHAGRHEVSVQAQGKPRASWALVSPHVAPLHNRFSAEYQRLLSGLQAQGALGGRDEDTQRWLANPALPEDVLREAVPGNIRRAGAWALRFGATDGAKPAAHAVAACSMHFGRPHPAARITPPPLRLAPSPGDD